MFVIHRIESLDDGTAQPSLDPPAFLHASLDFVNAAITFTRVVISSVDHHDVSRHTFEKIYRKVSNLRLRNGHDDHSAGSGRILNRYGLRPRLFRQSGEGCRPSPTNHEPLVSQLAHST